MQRTVSPSTGKVVVERTLPENAAVEKVIADAAAAQASWAARSLKERKDIVAKGTATIVSKKDELAADLALQMGRPLAQCGNEINGFKERAEYLNTIAESALADENVDEHRPDAFERTIRRVPQGVTFLIGAWNYPFLVQVNSLVPSILAGNATLVKPSPQTPLCMEKVVEAYHAAGVPKEVLQVLHLTPEQVELVAKHKDVSFISFTGSVANGTNLDKIAANTGLCKSVALELGGKDPAYVRADTDLDFAAENVVDGAMFNTGQSCCSIERAYVHESIYDEFVAKVVDVTKAYVLGDPNDSKTTLGPVISTRSAQSIRAQVKDALDHGAKALIPESHFALPDLETFVAPQILVDVTHDMKVIKDETFGPVLPIIKVASDDEAVKLMNDSQFGLTASVWTKDSAAFDAIVDKIDAGTVFFNRCDYLDPALPWTGYKLSGRGSSLSHIGFEAVTKPKSIHKRR